ncbi:MAG: asparagine synthase (glutamine-hydrolyzing) [Clostridiales bacterium]|jgi:asparagine synthase (glutamine-hydrolysing)|nr:asparagine synthase (glutamine-hydrolyzing) [Clostridiales bacterium]
MCGFVGFTEKAENQEEIISIMSEKIKHRGPDSSGVYADENITLGFRRLSIIDLSEEGSQPVFNEDKSIVIVFNGEIYNYQNLREELTQKGHVFYTHTDTETLVHLYEEYSHNMLNHLRGMFAFVIYDKNKNEIFAARDFFGIKPFYYTVFENRLLFASEIKAILSFPNFPRKVNETALESYLSFQYSVLPETFFKNIYKLAPGHYLTYKLAAPDTENSAAPTPALPPGGLPNSAQPPAASIVNIQKYYEVKFEPDGSLGFAAAAEKIDAAVADSVKTHMVSDVEVGSFLSSGVDSSYVAATFNGAKTFTVGFAYDNYNEISYAQNLSEKIKTENHSKTISDEEYWGILPKVQYHMDEPLADPSAVALYFVSQTAAKYVKVALSGEAADEFFGGYNIYKEPGDLKAFQKLPLFLRKFLSAAVSAIPLQFKGKSFLIRSAKTVEQRFIGNANIFSAKERGKLLKCASTGQPPGEITKPLYEKVKNADDVTKMQYLDIHLWMVGDILLKADKMSMAHSLEVRVPFVDKEVFACASKIPANLRVSKAGTKLAFREAARRHLPEDVASKKKLGFPVPIRVWLREEKYYQKIKAAFESDTAKKYFVTEELIKLLNRHKAGKCDNSRKIWTVYMFLVWHKQYFE